MSKSMTLKEFINELNKLIDENADRVNYEVYIDYTPYPDISVNDGDGSGKYDHRIYIN